MSEMTPREIVSELDKHIIGHFRKFAENLFAEQVFGAIPFSLEAEACSSTKSCAMK